MLAIIILDRAMKRSNTFETAPKPPRGILVGVDFPSKNKLEAKVSLQELEQLAHTNGIEVVKHFIQKLDHPTLSTFIGPGKVEEIHACIEANQIDLVVFDDDLKPAQVSNLEKIWRCQVWDRSFLILQIFAMNARTAEAKIQVELAKYRYLLPRLRGMWTHLSRQQGGIGGRGPGEKELETDKRIAQNKIRILKDKLAHIEKVATNKRKRRATAFKVALVGYTNAGKSTLMQCLSKEEVLVEDRLFATLSPTVRRVFVQGLPYLLSDTVGFIRKLPASLIASFRSTLAEVREADLLLHVVDRSNPAYPQQIAAVEETLKMIGAGEIPMILVFNKIDQLKLGEGETLEEGTTANEAKNQTDAYHCPVLYCSALKKQNIEALQTCIYQALSSFGPRSSMDRTRVS